VSPPGCNLYVSVVLRPPHLPARQLPQISLVAGVATCDAAAAYHPAALKWPNDVLVGGRKAAGILMEMEGEGARRFVIVGIGVNLNAGVDDFPPELREKAISLRLASGRPVDRPAFTAALLGHLETRYAQLDRDGFAPIAAAWHERADMIGRSVHVAMRGAEITGVVAGLDDDGALRLRLPSGAEQAVMAGDVTVLEAESGKR
jgi:BirA family biotin operon repressor/biotin-[acetyl-CoA-carboxylase] ligase